MDNHSEFIVDTEINAKGAEDGAKKVNAILSRVAQTAKEIRSALGTIFSKSSNKVPTKEYAELEREFARLEKRINKVGQSMDKFAASGGKENSSRYKNMTYDLEQLGAAQDKVLAKMKAMEESGTAYTSAQNKSNSSGKKGINIFSKLSKVFKGHSINVGQSFKNVLKYAFGIRSLFVLFNRLRRALIDGFNNLSQINNNVNPVNKALSDLKSSLTLLKNSFASAFAPILTTVAPILTAFIKKLADAINMLGMFFAKLTGAKSYTKAVYAQEQYADATDKASKAQDKLNKKLADYDKLMVVDQSSNSGSSGGGGVSADQMFETVDIDDTASDWAEKFKKAWETADFTGIGRTVSTKLKEQLDDIDWPGIKTKCNKIATSIATFINGFVEGGALSSMGAAIANGLNTVLETANTFLTTVKWKSLGEEMGKSINNFFKTFSFADVGTVIVNALIGAIDFVTGFAEEVDWEAIPQAIGDGVVKVIKEAKWKDLLVGIGNLAVAILKAIWDFHSGVREAWGDIAVAIADTIKGAIKDIKWEDIKEKVASGWKTVKGAISDVTANIKAKVATKWEDIKGKWEGLTKNIADKTAEMKAKVGSTWASLKNTWNNLLKNFKDKTVSIKVAFVDFFTAKIKAAWNGIANALNRAIGVINKIPGVNIDKIPTLAHGAVIPANHEFLAILGDQKSGTNIEAPLDTIVEAMQIALAKNGGSSSMPERIEITLPNGKVLAETVWEETEKKYKQTGYVPRYGF